VTRAISYPFGLLGSFAASALLWLAPLEASAQGRLDAHYEATLSGIPVGKGSWTIEIGDDAFSASAQGGSSGLLKAFSGCWPTPMSRPPRPRRNPRPCG
jgi:hypothetical protein